MENKETPGAPSLALRTVAICVLVAFVIGFAVGFITKGKFYPAVNLPVISVQRDTIVKRDTVNGKINPPTIRTIIRVDTVRLESTPDTTYHKDAPAKADTAAQIHLNPNGSITVPIEQRTYATDDYTAVVSGWHPALESITLYPKQTTITNTVTKLQAPRWSLSVGPSVGYGTTKAPIFGASVVFGLVIKSWQ